MHHHPPHTNRGFRSRRQDAGYRQDHGENDLTEHGFRIEDLMWLKKMDKPMGTMASLGIWLDSPRAAQRMIDILMEQQYNWQCRALPDQEKEMSPLLAVRTPGRVMQRGCMRRTLCGRKRTTTLTPDVRAGCLDCSREHLTGGGLCPAPSNSSCSQF